MVSQYFREPKENKEREIKSLFDIFVVFGGYVNNHKCLCAQLV